MNKNSKSNTNKAKDNSNECFKVLLIGLSGKFNDKILQDFLKPLYPSLQKIALKKRTKKFKKIDGTGIASFSSRKE